MVVLPGGAQVPTAGRTGGRRGRRRVATRIRALGRRHGMQGARDGLGACDAAASRRRRVARRGPRCTPRLAMYSIKLSNICTVQSCRAQARVDVRKTKACSSRPVAGLAKVQCRWGRCRSAPTASARAAAALHTRCGVTSVYAPASALPRASASPRAQVATQPGHAASRRRDQPTSSPTRTTPRPTSPPSKALAGARRAFATASAAHVCPHLHVHAPPRCARACHPRRSRRRAVDETNG